MSTLSVSVLGPPHVCHNMHQLTFSTRKAQALLIYLAVEGGEHSRKNLSELFWPEQDAAHGRAMLRHVILQLRDVLSEQNMSVQSHVLITRDTLNVAADVKVDVRAVHTAWTHVRRSAPPNSLADEHSRREILEVLSDAIQVCHGPFLSGFSLPDAPGFEDWVRYQRDIWQQRLHLIFARLVQLYAEAGEYGQALEAVTRWLFFDPLHEEAYQQAMRLYLAHGDRSGALRTYNTCRSLLARELNVQPTPETVALAERIRMSTLPIRDNVRHAHTPSTSPVA